MARTALTVQTINRNGVSPSYTAVDAANGNHFTNTGREFVHVKNEGAAAITLTVVTAATIEGVAIADLSITVAASGEQLVGPFPPAIFNDSSAMVGLDYSDGTAVTVGVFKL